MASSTKSQSASANESDVEFPATFDQMVEQDEDTAALVVAGDGQTIQAARVYVDAPVFSPDEIALPRLRIAQGLTQEVTEGRARPGQIVLLGHDAEDECTLIPLRFNRHRERRQGGGQDSVVLCQSGNAELGVGNPGGNCLTCPQAKWRPSVTRPGQNDPPDCKLGYAYICYSVTHGTVVELDIMTTNKGRQAAAQYVNTLIQHQGLGRFAMNLTTTSEKNARGQSYFIPQVQKVPVDPNTLAMAREALGQVEE